MNKQRLAIGMAAITIGLISNAALANPNAAQNPQRRPPPNATVQKAAPGAEPKAATSGTPTDSLSLNAKGADAKGPPNAQGALGNFEIQMLKDDRGKKP